MYLISFLCRLPKSCLIDEIFYNPKGGVIFKLFCGLLAADL